MPGCLTLVLGYTCSISLFDARVPCGISHLIPGAYTLASNVFSQAFIIIILQVVVITATVMRQNRVTHLLQSQLLNECRVEVRAFFKADEFWICWHIDLNRAFLIRFIFILLVECIIFELIFHVSSFV